MGIRAMPATVQRTCLFVESWRFSIQRLAMRCLPPCQEYKTAGPPLVPHVGRRATRSLDSCIALARDDSYAVSSGWRLAASPGGMRWHPRIEIDVQGIGDSVDRVEETDDLSGVENGAV